MAEINDAYNLEADADLSGLNQATDGIEELVDSILEADNAAEDVSSSADKSAKAVSDLGKKSDNTGDDVENLVDSLNDGDRAMTDLSGEAGDLESELTDAGDQAEETEQELRDMNETASDSESAFNNASSGLSGFAGAALGAVSAIGGLAVLQTVTGFMTESVGAGFELEKQLNRIGDVTGLMGSELEEAKDIARTLWSEGFGESPQEVVDAIGQVQNITDATGQTLQDLTTYALALSNTFGFDIQESTRAANQLMEQFGITGEEAFSIVAGIMQETGDPAGDLLDTLQEYSSIFAEMGLSADEVAGRMVGAAEAGVFGYDKTADAMREFTIRFKEGTDEQEAAWDSLIDKTGEFVFTTEGGLEGSIGSFDELQMAVSEGAISISDAGNMMHDALMQIEDPAERARIATTLIGTQYEDLGEDILAAFDDDGTLTNFDGTMASIAANTAKNISPMERFKRTMQTLVGQAITPMIRAVFDELNPALEGLSEWMQNGGLDSIDAFTSGIADDLAPTIDSVIDFVGGLIDEFQRFASENPQVIQVVMGIAAAIATAVTAFVAINAILGTVTAAVGAVSGGLAVLAPVIGFLLSPIGLLIAAATLLYLAYQTNFLGFRDLVNGAIAEIVPIVEGLIASLKRIWDDVQPKLAALAAWFTADAIPLMQTAVQTLMDNYITPFINLMLTIWDTISPTLQSLLDWFLTTGLNLIQDAIRAYMDLYVQPMIDLLLSIWTTVQPAFVSMFNWFMGDGLPLINDAVMDFINTYVQPMIDLLLGLWSAVSPSLNDLLNWFTTTGIPTMMTKITEIIEKFNAFRDRANTIWDAVQGGINKLKDNFNTFFGDMLQPITDIMTKIDELISLIGDIKFPKPPDWFSDIVGFAGQGLTAGGNSNITGARGFGEGFAGGSEGFGSGAGAGFGQPIVVQSYLMVDGQVLAQAIERVRAENPNGKARPTPLRATMGVL